MLKYTYVIQGHYILQWSLQKIFDSMVRLCSVIGQNGVIFEALLVGHVSKCIAKLN